MLPNLENLIFSIYIEKIEKNGEDAEPLVIEQLQNNCSLIGVFDGLGGAGGIKKYKVHNETRTSAYLASRVTKEIIINFTKNYNLIDIKLTLENDSQNLIHILENELNLKIEKLKSHILKGLKKADKIYIDNSLTSRVVGNIIKILPTTLSLLYKISLDNREFIIPIWAGDSRSYVLPIDGLMQLTIDDVDNPLLTLDSINQDKGMNNYINLTKDFKINYKILEINEKKKLLITASDGAFGVFDTPELFEKQILDTLQNSNNIREWKNKLELILKKLQDDDISIVIQPVGFKDFNEIKKYYIQRTKELLDNTSPYESKDRSIKELENKIEKYENKISSLNEEYKEIVNSKWDKYKNNYLKFIQ